MKKPPPSTACPHAVPGGCPKSGRCPVDWRKCETAKEKQVDDEFNVNPMYYGGKWRVDE